MRGLELAWLRQSYPHVRWSEPVAIDTPSGSGWDCRVCIASFGKKAAEGPRFATRAQAEAHIREHR